LTDIEGVASAGSSWTGYIKPDDAPAVNYEGDPDGLTIDGTRHEFTNGRIFLVETKGGTTTVEQIDIPVGSANYQEELSSIQQHKEIQDFLKR